MFEPLAGRMIYEHKSGGAIRFSTSRPAGNGDRDPTNHDNILAIFVETYGQAMDPLRGFKALKRPPSVVAGRYGCWGNGGDRAPPLHKTVGPGNPVAVTHRQVREPMSVAVRIC